MKLSHELFQAKLISAVDFLEGKSAGIIFIFFYLSPVAFERSEGQSSFTDGIPQSWRVCLRYYGAGYHGRKLE